jgi:hypothetical protein
MTPQVLLVSRDAMLLQTRQLILGAFFRAKSAGRIREAEELISTYSFDLIILCYTLTESECRRVIDLAAEQKRHPRILVLTPAGIPPDPGSADAAMTEAGPYYLLKKSAELLGMDIRANASLVAV